MSSLKYRIISDEKLYSVQRETDVIDARERYIDMGWVTIEKFVTYTEAKDLIKELQEG